MATTNILIVDDIKQNVFALRQILQSDGYTLYESSSGAKCLEILLQEEIHIVLLDIQMPGMDGFEVASLIRSNPKTKQIPILFITATNQTEYIDVEAYQAGAIDIIYKPINKVILRQKIQTLVDLITIQQELENKVQQLTKLNEENTKMRRKIEELASKDYLTQIMNRRSLAAQYEKFFKNAVRNEEPISVLMVDLDHFKHYNDYFGHQKGDKALKTIATILQGALKRPLDVVGRYGGEEFMIVLPKTDREGAIEVAKTILKETRKKHINQAPTASEDYLTVSIGVATVVPNTESNKDTLIKKADDHLYKAKDAGRNQVK